MSSKASQDTLDKVAQMKARVAETVNNRIQGSRDRRLRLMQLEHQFKAMDVEKGDQRKYLRDFVKNERAGLREQRNKIGLKDFSVVKVIGKGAFGEVRIVRDKANRTPYAMKSMRKADMIQKNQAGHVQAERDLMAQAIDDPFLVKLFFSFQDDTYLYLVMEFCGGGDLMTILMKEDILSPRPTAFYMAELSLAINAVHELDFVHRDLKPDNVLIDNAGHVKLSDFGLAKSWNTQNDSLLSKYQKNAETLKEEPANAKSPTKGNRAARRDRKLMFSTVGTPDYIAPEVFSQKGYGKMVDWWSMGVIMYECLMGYPPFYADDPLQTCRKIVHYRKYFNIPKDSNLSPEAMDLLHNLVCNHRRRYGFQQIQNHPFFKSNGIKWKRITETRPPFVPKMNSDVDASNFEDIDSEQNFKSEQQFKPSKTTDNDHFWGYTFKAPINMQSAEIQKMMSEMEEQKKQKDEVTESQQNDYYSNQPQSSTLPNRAKSPRGKQGNYHSATQPHNQGVAGTGSPPPAGSQHKTSQSSHQGYGSPRGGGGGAAAAVGSPTAHSHSQSHQQYGSPTTQRQGYQPKYGKKPVPKRAPPKNPLPKNPPRRKT